MVITVICLGNGNGLISQPGFDSDCHWCVRKGVQQKLLLSSRKCPTLHVDASCPSSGAVHGI